jgi:septum formation protein
VIPTEVRFRILTQATIEAYLRVDQPYDCAGSARIEGLGIALVERVRSDDPTALLGLPLIALLDLLAAEGLTTL